MNTPAETWLSSDGPLAAEHDSILLDLDGVVYVGEQAVEGAVAAIRAVRERGLTVAFVTNNAARTPQAVAEHLSELGVTASAADVVTSAQAAADMLREQLPAGARVLAVGADGLTTALRDVGLRPVTGVDDSPVAVVQGFSPDTSWRMLAEACVAVRSGLPWVATNVDVTLPTPAGPAPGNGAFVDVVRRTTGVEPQVAGKPYRPLLDAAVKRTGARRPLMVGDRLDTDLAGARTVGMPGLLVLTGVSAVVDLLAATSALRPSYLAADLGGLLAPHRAPTHDGQSWRDGEVSAGWADDGTGRVRLELSGPASSPDDVSHALSAVRAACTAVWQRSDSGAEVAMEQVRSALSPWTAPQGWDR